MPLATSVSVTGTAVVAAEHGATRERAAGRSGEPVSIRLPFPV